MRYESNLFKIQPSNKPFSRMNPLLPPPSCITNTLLDNLKPGKLEVFISYISNNYPGSVPRMKLTTFALFLPFIYSQVFRHIYDL